MQTKYQCVLICIWIKGEVGALLNRFKPSSKIFYWPFQGGTFFVDLLCFCSVLCLLFLCVRLFNCVLWSPAGKGLTSWLSFVVSNWFCNFPIGILGRVCYLIVSIPDLCTLTYFQYYHSRSAINTERSAPNCSVWKTQSFWSNCCNHIVLPDCKGVPNRRFSCNIMLYFFRKLEKMSQDLSSAAVVIGALKGYGEIHEAYVNIHKK